MYKQWNTEEINLLKQKYKEHNNKRKLILKFFPGRTEASISHKLSRIGLRNSNFTWTKEKIRLLKKIYPSESKKNIAKKIGNTWEHIRGKATKVNVHRIKVKNHNLSKLLKNNVLAYYWMGFLMADGCFSKTPRNNYCLSLEIANKDKSHLKKFSSFVNNDNPLRFRSRKVNKILHNMASVCFCDNDILKKIMAKYDLHNKKTYFPPKFNKIFKNTTDKNIFSFIVGFIDGDGCIRRTDIKSLQIAIECHKSWFNFLKDIENFLFRFFDEEKTKKNYTRLNCRKEANFTISRRPLICKIKQKAAKLNLPLLNRKWNVIKQKDIEKYQFIENKTKTISDLFRKGYSSKEACKKLKVDRGWIKSKWMKAEREYSIRVL